MTPDRMADSNTCSKRGRASPASGGFPAFPQVVNTNHLLLFLMQVT